MFSSVSLLLAGCRAGAVLTGCWGGERVGEEERQLRTAQYTLQLETLQHQTSPFNLQLRHLADARKDLCGFLVTGPLSLTFATRFL